MRRPPPTGSTHRVTVPGHGANPRAGSSALIRTSTACPVNATSDCRIRSGSPAATASCAATMSTPVTSSVTGCSTWMRVRGDLGVRTGEFHERYDLLVTPMLPITAFEAGVEVPPGWPRER